MKITPAYYYLTAAAKVGLAVLSLLLIFLFNYCHISHPIMIFVSYALDIVSALIVPFFFLMLFLEHKNDDQLSIVSILMDFPNDLEISCIASHHFDSTV